MTGSDNEKFKRLGFSEDQLHIANVLLLGRDCGTCKYTDKGICEEPCSSCDIRLGNNKWEPKEGEDEQ